MKHINKILFSIAFILVYALLCYLGIASDIDEIAEPYDVRFIEASEVYDGDTIQDILIDCTDLDPKKPYPYEMVFLGIVIEGKDVYAYTDIRIAGIDTPEKKPKKEGRTEESRQAEKAAAQKAQEALVDLLAQYDYRFEIENPQPDKYWGRIIADVFVGTGEERVSVGAYMIEQGLAYEYDGGTKKAFDEWYQQGE